MVLVLSIVIPGPDLSSATVLCIISIGMAIISAIMLAGRGAWAMAGYNTMSPEEKFRYDPRKIARGGGVIMLGVTVFLASFMFGGLYLMIGIAAMMFAMLAGALYMNRYAKL